MSYVNRGGSHRSGGRYRGGSRRPPGSGDRYAPSPRDDSPRHSPREGRRPPAGPNGYSANGSSTPREPRALPSEPRALQGITGTDLATGENPKDARYGRQGHHQAAIADAAKSMPPSKPKTYRVVYDPEMDPTLAKHEKKTRKREFAPAQAVTGTIAIDPRTENVADYFRKPNKQSKKFPFKQLPQPKYAYSRDSVGPAPQTSVVLWDLPATVNETYIVNYFRGYGVARKIKFFNDDEYAVPLGIATFEFDGSPEKSSRTARKAIAQIRAEAAKIDGAPLRIDLDSGSLLESKLGQAQDQLREEKRRRDDEERRQRKADEAKRRQEELRKREEEKKAAKLAEQKAAQRADQLADQTEPRKKTLSDVTILPRYYGGRIVKGYVHPAELGKYIKQRPFLFIKARFVPPQQVPLADVKSVLEEYRWSRILDDRTGFYVVFKSLKEAERCFKREDGRRLAGYRMNMEMAVPPEWQEPRDVRSSQAVVREAVQMLVAELQTFLAKDIRERIIAPTIIDLLDHKHYPELVARLQEEEAQKKAREAERAAVATHDKHKENALAILRQQQQRMRQPLPKIKKKVIPLQHALNYDTASESEEESEDEPDRKRAAEDDHRPHKRTKTSLLYESEDEDEPKQEPEPEPAADVPEHFMPTPGRPHTVYDEHPVVDPPLARLQSVVKDDEDLALAREVLGSVDEPSQIGNIEYWAWKEQAQHSASHEICEDIELIAELDDKLENRTGSFRSQGYRKIVEADKIAYLPHKRKAHAAAEAKLDAESDRDHTPKPNGIGSSTTVSSRVNRANIRRFAADVNAQLGAETEVLSLNQLTKRKKPVTFARSTIHNWGLYALEAIGAKEMIIEYVGESIRQAVAEVRERAYMKTGIGSSYLFRVDENTVIDATRKGGIARFINHCCSPSCTAKIIKVDGRKRIVIYALRDIEANEELTYDYKFERDTNDDERIRCLCGAPGCKGYLN
ncbi:histone-lysine N-methyltransferase, H3 lysine-4 specific [Diutina catenulata]